MLRASCCSCCRIPEQGELKDQCAPQDLMAAKMVDKCPKFEPILARGSFSPLFQSYIKKYRLETEDGT